ncbi:MAG: DUF3800 domain-containing protein [Terriglobales bacterium]
MLGFYMDDSADQKRQTVFSVAGFVIEAGDTFETERSWDARLEREGIDYFRAYDCINLEGEFRKKLVDLHGLTTARVIADAVYNDCKTLAALAPMYGYAACVKMDDYRLVAGEPDGQIVLNEDPYIFAHHLLMGIVLEAVNEFPREEVVAFLYDEHSKAALLQNSWTSFRRSNPTWARPAGTLAPLDDKIHAMLQMADLFANATTRFFQEFQTGPEIARAKMKEWLGDHLMRIVYVNERWLREAVAGNVERMKKLDAKGGIIYPK